MKMDGIGRSLALLSIFGSVASAENIVIDMRDEKVVAPKSMTDVKDNFKNDSAETSAKKLDELKKAKLEIEPTPYGGNVARPAPIKIISTKDKSLGVILSQIAEKEGKIYILRGLDFVIKDEYEVRSIEELEKVVEINSNYRLQTEQTGIESTYIAKLVQKTKERQIALEAKVDLLGLKRILLTEFNVKLVISKNIMESKKTEMAHIYGEYTLEELIEDLEEQYNLWFVLKDNKLYVKEEKEISFDVKRIGDFSIDFSQKSASSTGAGGASDDAATGFLYKVGDESSEKFAETLKINFPTIKFKDSYSGFISGSVRPREFKEVTEFFNNIEKRHELINGEILLLNLRTDNAFAFESDWSKLLIQKNLLKLGSNGTMFLDSASTTSPNELGGQGTPSSSLKVGSSADSTAGAVFKALETIGDISIVDKWTIATATGIPTGFTNYEKTPYFTQEANNMLMPAITNPTNGVATNNTNMALTYNIHYALTGFKATFKVNKTAKRSYIIDGAIDYSSIIDMISANGDQATAPEIHGKSMRLYTEFDSLDKTIVIGGFKNLKNQSVDKQTPFFGSLPLIGWLFKNVNDSKSEDEFIILIRLNSPAMLDNKQRVEKYSQIKSADGDMKPSGTKDEEKIMEQQADSKRFDIFE